MKIRSFNILWNPNLTDANCKSEVVGSIRMKDVNDPIMGNGSAMTAIMQALYNAFGPYASLHFSEISVLEIED